MTDMNDDQWSVGQAGEHEDKVQLSSSCGIELCGWCFRGQLRDNIEVDWSYTDRWIHGRLMDCDWLINGMNGRDETQTISRLMRWRTRFVDENIDRAMFGIQISCQWRMWQAGQHGLFFDEDGSKHNVITAEQRQYDQNRCCWLVDWMITTWSIVVGTVGCVIDDSPDWSICQFHWSGVTVLRAHWLTHFEDVILSTCSLAERLVEWLIEWLPRAGPVDQFNRTVSIASLHEWIARYPGNDQASWTASLMIKVLDQWLIDLEIVWMVYWMKNDR